MGGNAFGEQIRYVAIGDSFTEGVGDELPNGHVRGWADQVAQGIADATGETVLYANLAIRGRLLTRIHRCRFEAGDFSGAVTSALSGHVGTSGP